MIGVAGASRGYRAALAELPLRTAAVDDVRDAIVVIDGSPQWAHRARLALQGGASALVIARPGAVDDEQLAALEQLAGPTPIVLDRPWLRADLLADAVARDIPLDTAPSVVSDLAGHVTADVVAVDSELGDLVRDAIGWLRTLAGGPLRMRAAEAVPHGVIALFEHADSGRAAALTASALVGRGGARLRAHSVGVTRVEIDLDAATHLRSIVVTTAEGALSRPRRHEAPERLALRRAVEAVVEGVPTADLGDFRHDSALAAQVRANKRG